MTTHEIGDIVQLISVVPKRGVTWKGRVTWLSDSREWLSIAEYPKAIIKIKFTKVIERKGKRL